MAATRAPAAPASGNLRKHTSGNPLQRWLLRRFQQQIIVMVASALAAAKPEREAAVLEVGCGEGFVLAGLAATLPELEVSMSLSSPLEDTAAAARSPLPRRERTRERGVAPGPTARDVPLHLIGLDIRPDALQVAAQLAPAASLARADALHLPLAPASADIVLCLEVLEHLTDPWSAVAELRRVARGTVIMSVPNQPWFALANLARGKNFSTWGDDPEHVNHWRGGSFLRLLGRHATVREVVYSFPWVIAVCDGGG